MTNQGAQTCGPADPCERSYQERGFEAIASLIREAHTIAICAHTSPDGDALGCVLAMALIIRGYNPDASVATLLADDAPVPRIYQFLPESQGLVPACSYHDTPDLFVALDLSEAKRLNQAQDVCARARHTAVIDHHPTKNPFGEANVIRPGAAAAGVLVAEFALKVGVDITPQIAQCLLCAIVTDTGRFQYQNTDAESFRVASLLVDKGASPSEISLNVYQSFRLSFLHLKSLVLGRITTFEKGRIAYSYATQNDLERTGADLDECDGLIDVVRSVSGSEVALFLKKVPGGMVRGNLRSKDNHDVSKVARLMGGGGHKAAAGFTYEGDVDEVLAAVLPHLRALFSDQSPQSDAEGV
ncbi:MAG: DHH family phosphoesterase [Coriobacteriales bacterium]|nr:DHH family phosphoesterase [Coriobacteriales bacterium]